MSEKENSTRHSQRARIFGQHNIVHGDIKPRNVLVTGDSIDTFLDIYSFYTLTNEIIQEEAIMKTPYIFYSNGDNAGE